MADDEEGVPLAAALNELRSELVRAMEQAANENLLFEPVEVTLEFQVGITKDRGGSAGLQFWVIELGGKLGRSNSQTQTITLRLKPANRDGSPVKIKRKATDSPLAGDAGGDQTTGP